MLSVWWRSSLNRRRAGLWSGGRREAQIGNSGLEVLQAGGRRGQIATVGGDDVVAQKPRPAALRDCRM